MVALLATAPKMRRARRWIQSKLWSDRGQAQANASLRQALTELRKSLGPMAAALQADRQDVWLDPAMVQVILPGAFDPGPDPGAEFLSGIDIRDEAFEDWLREMRMAFAPGPASPGLAHKTGGLTAPIQLVPAAPLPQSDAPFVANVTVQEITRYVCERSWACPAGEGPETGAVQIEIRCELNDLGASSQAHFQAIHRPDGRTICSRFGEFPVPAFQLLDNPAFRRLIPEFGEQLSVQFPNLHPTAPFEQGVFHQLHTAIADIFSYQAERLNGAEANLLSAYERTGNPSILLWLAWQKTTQVIEETTSDKDTATEMARYYCSKALEAEPHSAFANALSSLVHMIHFDEAEASFLLAERASGLSKFDPYVQAALATANMFAGRSKEAARNSLIGTRLSRFAGNAHWWDLSHSLACLSNGDWEMSEQFALRASRASPNFRAPKRVLLALYASQNRIESALDQMDALKRTEPSFELDRFLRDPDYPNTTLRNAGLLRDPGKFDL